MDINEDNTEFELYDHILGDDMLFPKAIIDPNLIKLQKDDDNFYLNNII